MDTFAPGGADCRIVVARLWPVRPDVVTGQLCVGAVTTSGSQVPTSAGSSDAHFLASVASQGHLDQESR
jgi:hypothetical protein